MDPISNFIMDHLIDVTAEIVLPLMIVTFFVGVVVRALVWFTAREEAHFAREFEKRVHRYSADPDGVKFNSFHQVVRHLLGKTYYEIFELKHKYKRRNLDHVTSITDRLFLIQDGVARVIQDTLRSTKYMRRDGFPPKMIEVTKFVYENNPVFNRLMGLFPVGLLNELLNILPGLFVIGGIFGTFLGISRGLPELGNMDLAHMEETKHVMDMFLAKIGQSMIKSIVGIFLSVTMSLINTVMSPDGLYYALINRFSGSLEHLWNETTTNEVDRAEPILDGAKNVFIPDNVRESGQGGGGRGGRGGYGGRSAPPQTQPGGEPDSQQQQPPTQPKRAA